MATSPSRLFILLALTCVIGLASSHILKADDYQKGDQKKDNYFTIYTKANFEGEPKNLTIPTSCKKLPLEFNNKVKSVQLYGDCVYLYNDKNCKGNNAWPLTLNENLPSVKDTPLDSISSYKACKI